MISIAKKIQNNKTIYKLIVADCQIVAQETLNRILSQAEIQLLQEKIGEYIDWHSAIQLAIWQNISNNGTDNATNSGDRTSIEK
jgi:hypothetical protein